MKVIFRLTKLGTPDEYRNLAYRIFNQWNETPDLGCLVVPPDVEVYVVDSDSEIEVEDDKAELFSPETTFDDIMKMVMGKENETS